MYQYPKVKEPARIFCVLLLLWSIISPSPARWMFSRLVYISCSLATGSICQLIVFALAHWSGPLDHSKRFPPNRFRLNKSQQLIWYGFSSNSDWRGEAQRFAAMGAYPSFKRSRSKHLKASYALPVERRLRWAFIQPRCSVREAPTWHGRWRGFRMAPTILRLLRES